MNTSPGLWNMSMFGPNDRWVRDAEGRGIAEVSESFVHPMNGILLAAAPGLRDALSLLLNEATSGNPSSSAKELARAALAEAGEK